MAGEHVEATSSEQTLTAGSRARRPSSLFRRFFLTAAVSTFVIASISVCFTVIATDRLALLYQEQQLRGLAEKVVKELAAEDYSIAAISREFDRLRVTLPAIELYVLDERGQPEVWLGVFGSSCCTAVDTATLDRFLTTTAPMSATLIVHPADPRAHEVFSVARFRYAGTPHYLLLLPGTAERGLSLESLRENYGLIVTILLAALLALLSTATAAFTMRFLAARFATLVQSVERFAAGDLTARIRDPKADEIGRLSDSFDGMANTLAETVAQLTKRDAVRRELIADVSHDLRRPLQLLRLNVDGIVRDGQKGTVPEAASLAPLSGNLDSLERLLDELFELAKLEGRDAPLEMVKFDAGDFVAEVVTRFQPLARSRGVTLQDECGRSRALVSAQPELLERALGNLIENALRHTAAGGSVTVRVDVDDSSATLSVVDTGLGIAAEERERLFERFAQGKSQPEQHGGCGLGLSIVRKIVEAHGSTVAVHSAEGEGTTFSFRLALCSLLLGLAAAAWQPRPCRAEDARDLRVSVVQAGDPSALRVRSISCPEMQGATLLTGADLAGTGAALLVTRSSDGSLAAWTITSDRCTRTHSMHDSDPSLGIFAGAMDADQDGRAELYFLADGRRLVQVVRLLDGNLTVETPWRIAPPPNAANARAALISGKREPGLVVAGGGEVNWYLFKAKRPAWATWGPAGMRRLFDVAHTRGDDAIFVDPGIPGAIAQVDLSTGWIAIPDDHWATFPFGSAVAARTGDFDGDGVAELLAELPGAGGYWLRTADPDREITFPVASPLHRSLDESVVADFDGDGVDELMWLSKPDDGTLLLAALPALPPYEGASVSLDGKPAGVTDRAGTLTIPLSKERHTVRAASSSGRFRSTARDVAVWEQHVRLVVPGESGRRSDGAAFGNTAPLEGPRICLGYRPGTTDRTRSWEQGPQICEQSSAFFGLDDTYSTIYPRFVACCPLPAGDILLPQSIVVEEFCPADMVATGLEKLPRQADRFGLRCTKINTERYRLAPAKPGVYWGAGYSHRAFHLALARHEIPLGIRYAFGRYSASSWDDDGCIGSPPGSLFVGGFSGKCSETKYSELLERRPEGDVPVKMFPDCTAIGNILDPRSGCTVARELE